MAGVEGEEGFWQEGWAGRDLLFDERGKKSSSLISSAHGLDSPVKDGPQFAIIGLSDQLIDNVHPGHDLARPVPGQIVHCH